MSVNKWFVGIDWATTEHVVCLLDEHGKVLGKKAFAHSGAGISEMCAWLVAKAGGAATSGFHVAIEVPHGAVVETLLERGMNVYAINPKQLDRFRDRFTAAGAKDDRRDAHVLADSLRTDLVCFRLLKVDSPIIIELRQASRLHDELKEDRIRLANRLWQQFVRYFPQMLEVADDIARDWVLGLWELVPTPERAARVRENTIANYLLKKKIRSITASEIIAELRKPALVVAPGTVEAASLQIKALIARLRPVNELLRTNKKRLGELVGLLDADAAKKGNEHRDVTIMLSLAGVGQIVIAAMLAEASQPLEARNYQAIRSLGGLAPVTKSSGKRSGPRATVVMRQACNPRLREAFYYWALSATKHDPPSKAAYQALRARGKPHGQALRTVADRLLNVLCAMLRDGTLYDSKRRSAPLAA